MLYMFLLSLLVYTYYNMTHGGSHEMERLDLWIMTTVVLIVVLFSVFNRTPTADDNEGDKNTVVERFQDEQDESPQTAAAAILITTESAATNTRSDVYTNPTYKDNLLDVIVSKKLLISLSDIVAYFSCFESTSFLRNELKLKSIAPPFLNHRTSSSPHENVLTLNQYSTEGYKLNVSDMLIDYNQRDGINLKNNVEIIGFKLDAIKDVFTKEFSIVWYLKITPFQNNDFDYETKQYTLFEGYSSNVKGSIALGVYLNLYKLSNKNVISFDINYGGIVQTYALADEYVNRLNGYHLITLEKLITSENEHVIQLLLDENTSSLVPAFSIRLEDIEYVTSSRQTIALSREPFVINKQLKGTTKERVKMPSLNMRLISFAIFQKSLSKVRVGGGGGGSLNQIVFETLEEQRTIKLSKTFEDMERSTAELTATMNAAKLEASKCRLPEELCSQCPDVDWSDWNTILNGSPICLERIRNYCSNVYHTADVDYKGVYDSNVCQLMYSPPPPSPPSPPPPSPPAAAAAAERPAPSATIATTATSSCSPPAADSSTSSNSTSHNSRSSNIPPQPTTNPLDALDLGKYDFDELAKKHFNKPIGNLNKNDILEIANTLSRRNTNIRVSDNDDNSSPRPPSSSLKDDYNSLKRDYSKKKNRNRRRTDGTQKYITDLNDLQEEATAPIDKDYGTTAYERILKRYNETSEKGNDLSSIVPKKKTETAADISHTTNGDDTKSSSSSSFSMTSLISTLTRLFQ
jgi:hypothetical protein